MSGMDRFRRKATPAGQSGVRTVVKEHPKGEPERTIHEEIEKEPLPPPSPLEGDLASVGLSVSIGQATDYSREKVEVTAWCTLPCGITPEERQDAYDECARHVLSEVKSRLDKAVEQFFPHIGKGA